VLPQTTPLFKANSQIFFSGDAGIDEAGKQRIMELLDGEDASTGMFSSTALHKAAYRQVP
jgi:hypothetical protein